MNILYDRSDRNVMGGGLNMEEMILSQAMDASPQIFRPWRRFWARMLDWWLYGRLWMVIQILVLNINAAAKPNTLGTLIIDTVVQIGLLLALEPVFLSRWGTTPGKWILGLYVTHKSGRLLTHAEALTRTGQVLSHGMGFGIPIYDLVRLYMSYKTCAAGVRQVWDEDTAYSLRAENARQVAVYIGTLLVVLGLVLLAHGHAQLPKHRGELTPAQFAANVNKLNVFQELLPGYTLQEDGSWQRQIGQNGVIYVGSSPVDFELTLTEGYVSEVRFAREVRANQIVGSDAPQMYLAILAFAGAQKDIHAWDTLNPPWLKKLPAFESFAFDWGRAKVQCTVHYSGYSYNEALNGLWPVDGVPHDYQLEFVITQQ